jgi:hypothetical protein
MKLPISSKPFTGLLAALFVICLAGCKEDIALLDDNGKVIGKGTLEITANFPSPARLTLDGKEYTGLWNVAKIYEADLARSRRLISDRAYMAYETGDDPEQLKHGHANLTAGDGSTIQCDFYYRRQPGAGSCNEDGKQLKLRVQRPGYS